MSEESSTPQEATAPAESPALPADGGSSKALTQGEIIFVTLLTFIVVLAAAVAAYFVWRRRMAKKNETLNRKPSQEGGTTEMSCAVDCETGPMMDDHQHNVEHLNNNGVGPEHQQYKRKGSDDSGHRRATLDGSYTRGSSDGSGHGNRRATHDGSFTTGTRRATLDGSNTSGGGRRASSSRRESEGSMERGNRRATVSSMGANVSRNYKQAAIEHMNQITQSGRHE